MDSTREPGKIILINGASSSGWMSDLVNLLTGLDVFFVGVHCPRAFDRMAAHNGMVS